MKRLYKSFKLNESGTFINEMISDSLKNFFQLYSIEEGIDASDILTLININAALQFDRTRKLQSDYFQKKPYNDNNFKLHITSTQDGSLKTANFLGHGLENTKFWEFELEYEPTIPCRQVMYMEKSAWTPITEPDKEC